MKGIENAVNDSTTILHAASDHCLTKVTSRKKNSKMERQSKKNTTKNDLTKNVSASELICVGQKKIVERNPFSNDLRQTYMTTLL